MEQRSYWNSVANDRDFTTEFNEKVFSQYVTKDAQILDVGCGYGRTLNELYQAGYKNLAGVDSSIGMLERGRREFPHLKLMQNDIGLPFENDSFDVVIIFGVLTSVVDNVSQKALIKEIYRVLKSNGIIYVNDFLINTSLIYKLKYKI